MLGIFRFKNFCKSRPNLFYFKSVIDLSTQNKTVLSSLFKLKPKLSVLDLFESKYLIKFVTKQRSIQECLITCNLDSNCSLVVRASNNCKLYNNFAFYYLKIDPNSNIYYKTIKQESDFYLFNTSNIDNLTHYWPFLNNYNDLIGESHMYDGENYRLSLDRDKNKNSALRLEKGYRSIPAGFYFNQSEFSVTVWVKPYDLDKFSKLFNFGNKGSAQIGLGLTWGENGVFYFEIKGQNHLRSKEKLIIQEWSHIGLTFESGLAKLYFNGSLVQKESYDIPDNVLRKNCNFGKSDWEGNVLTNADLDEIKFYDKCLSNLEVQDEYLGLKNILTKI